jgi:hypothetical protein
VKHKRLRTTGLGEAQIRDSRLSTSVNYAVITLNLLDHQARGSRVEIKKAAYRKSCVAYLHVLITGCADI